MNQQIWSVFVNGGPVHNDIFGSFFLVWLSSINWTMLSYSGWNGSCMFYHVGWAEPCCAVPCRAGPCWPEFNQTGAECRSLVGGSRTVAALAVLRLPDTFSVWKSDNWRQSEISDQDFSPFFKKKIHSALVFTLTVVIRGYLLYIV